MTQLQLTAPPGRLTLGAQLTCGRVEGAVLRENILAQKFIIWLLGLVA